MQQPSEYALHPFCGCTVMVVEAGTEIKDERTGRTETVEENSAVTKGPLIYCTQRTYDALTARVH